MHVVLQTELISGDQNGNIRVWDLTANSCSCELVCFVSLFFSTSWIRVANLGMSYYFSLGSFYCYLGNRYQFVILYQKGQSVIKKADI